MTHGLQLGNYVPDGTQLRSATCWDSILINEIALAGLFQQHVTIPLTEQSDDVPPAAFQVSQQTASTTSINTLVSAVGNHLRCPIALVHNRHTHTCILLCKRHMK